MNPVVSYGLNCTIIILLQVWLLHWIKHEILRAINLRKQIIFMVLKAISLFKKKQDLKKDKQNVFIRLIFSLKKLI